MKPIAILGGGSWGTAVAIHMARKHPVLLWSRDEKSALEMQHTRVNAKYLPEVIFPPNLSITSDLSYCINQASQIIIAVPSHAFEALFEVLPHNKQGIAWLTKGLDPKGNQNLSTLVAKKWGEDYPVALISGPSFAKEVAKGLPTALIVASNNQTLTNSLHTMLHHHSMRVYKSDDMTGIQWCGAVKNVLAIACGISDGLCYGANAKAAIITRGLHEMTKTGLKLGGQLETFTGLAGLGDLVLTCTDNQSRNRKFGLLIGEGKTQQEAEKTVGQVVEGKHNAAQVVHIAKIHGIEMPICEAVHKILSGQLSPSEAEKSLLARPIN